MGCNASNDATKEKGGSTTSQAKRSQQPRAPILLFYLPSNVREVLTKLIASNLITSETATQADRLNIRFVDIPNQRSMRRYWPREFTNKMDYAAALYVADIRERGSLLLNERTLNWFLKFVPEKYNLIIVAICSNEVQRTEFQAGICAKNIEMLVLNEKNPETVVNFVEVVSSIVTRFNENKRNG